MADVLNASPTSATKKQKKHDMKALTDTAAQLVQASQRADYAFLEKEMHINPSIAQQLLKRLRTKGLVAQRVDRRWVVLVNTDGSKKPVEEVPSLKRFKTKSGKKQTKSGSVKGVSAPKSAVAKPLTKMKETPEVVTAHPHQRRGKFQGENVTTEEKLEFIKKVRELATGDRSKVILHAITLDVIGAEKFAKIVELFKD